MSSFPQIFFFKYIKNIVYIPFTPIYITKPKLFLFFFDLPPESPHCRKKNVFLQWGRKESVLARINELITKYVKKFRLYFLCYCIELYLFFVFLLIQKTDRGGLLFTMFLFILYKKSVSPTHPLFPFSHPFHKKSPFFVYIYTFIFCNIFF